MLAAYNRTNIYKQTVKKICLIPTSNFCLPTSSNNMVVLTLLSALVVDVEDVLAVFSSSHYIFIKMPSVVISLYLSLRFSTTAHPFICHAEWNTHMKR